jgi:hypothetical protein
MFGGILVFMETGTLVTEDEYLHTAQGHGTLTDGVLRIPEAGIVVPLREVFED